MSIVACASESCAASLMVLSSRSEVRWVGRSLQAAWNPAIFCLQEAIPVAIVVEGLPSLDGMNNLFFFSFLSTSISHMDGPPFSFLPLHSHMAHSLSYCLDLLSFPYSLIARSLYLYKPVVYTGCISA